MYRCLNTAMINVEAPPEQSVSFASQNGFKGCDLPIPAIDDDGALKAAMDSAGVIAGSAGGLVPGRVSVSESDWAKGMEYLPERIKTARALGFTRTTTVILPFHESLPYDACFELHVSRIRQIAGPLAAAGIRLGLEYVSQTTRRASYPFEFIYNLRGTLALLEAVGAPNVGILLDSFHWFCAGESADDIRALSNEQIVVVHVNDSIAGRRLEDQIAFERELPGATGIIDLEGFLAALRTIGYDGPVTAEPMCEVLKKMTAADAVRAVAASMEKIGI